MNTILKQACSTLNVVWATWAKYGLHVGQNGIQFAE
jgi:hypothetical protein